MDEAPPENAATATGEPEQAPSSEAAPASLDPPDEPAPSTSALSSAPMTDAPEPPGSPVPPPKAVVDPGEEAPTQQPQESAPAESSPKPSDDAGNKETTFQQPPISAQTESIVKKINDNAASAAASGTPGWEAAREQVMRDMQTSDKTPTSSPPKEAAPTQEGGQAAADPGTTAPTTKMEIDTTQITPASANVRGRGGGRPRGRGRGGRGSKRKRERSDDELTEDSEVYTPVVTTTKSGRSVQKPTAFVPAPASPPSSSKRKRPYRKNPESAVCKICLRGTSPANNMIVFCDGCNSPYHRYCHHPPIDQAVVDEVDKEWYCKQCERERVAPVPESEIAHFISAEGAPVEQRQRYFASLSPGMLVTLLTRATSLKPDLPVFAPDFRARIGSITAAPPPTAIRHASNGHAHPHSGQQQMPAARLPTAYPAGTYAGPYSTSHAAAGAVSNAPQHRPQQYMQSYATPAYGPDVHPPHYPQPGHGMMRSLPPEQEDLQWLVDDNDRYGVYGHMYNAQPPMANPGMNGGMGRPQQ